MRLKAISPEVKEFPQQVGAATNDRQNERRPNQVKKLSQWIQANRSQKIVKFIVGIRGMEKSQVLRKCLPKDAIRIDFDDPKWRRLKTAEDVIAHLDGGGFIETALPDSSVGRVGVPPPTAPDSPTAPLLLEEPGRIFGHTTLLRTLVESGKWNVFVVASNCHAIEDMREYWPEGKIAQFRVWRRVGRPRSEEYLFAVCIGRAIIRKPIF